MSGSIDSDQLDRIENEIRGIGTKVGALETEQKKHAEILFGDHRPGLEHPGLVEKLRIAEAAIQRGQELINSWDRVSRAVTRWAPRLMAGLLTTAGAIVAAILGG